jgi:hypothetical protein
MQNLEKFKFKHNKKRNTAFLFESLVKELTKSVVFGDKERQKTVSNLIKEHFKKNGILDRELTLYKQFYETRQFPKQYAEKLISQVKSEHEKLDETEIFNEQSKLIAKVNKTLGFDVYNNFVPNYKTLATVSQIFNSDVEPKKKVLLEQELLEHITGEEQVKKTIVETIDNVTMKRFIERFNEAYSNSLLPEQKQLLSRFITSGDDDLELKIYLNEEICRLKDVIINCKKADIIKENKEIEQKVDKMHLALTNLKIETINEELIKKIMLIQEFVSEVNK